MSSLAAATANPTLARFIEGANAQYRDAGLGQYQMRVQRDGSVDVPNAPRAKFRSPAPSAGTSGEAAPAQADAGAAQVSPDAAQVKRSGAAPTISDLQQGGTDAFKMTWKPVEGAKQYGIWQNGVLLGHVPQASFAGQVPSGGGGTIQIDAVRADGSRSELTKALVVGRGSDGKLTFSAAGAAGTAATQGATAGAAATS